MEFTTEQITELGLTDDNTSKLSAFIDDKIATTKKEYDGLANDNAEKILTGASRKIFEDTKIERQQGEKVGDYLTRAWGEFNSNKITELDGLKVSYETKIKDFKGNDDLISKISGLETANDDMLRKYANYDELKDKAELYEPLIEKYNANKLEVAFSGVKPIFPKEVNIYEVDSKWKDFKNEILNDYEIEIVEGTPIAISKENKHKQVKLADLVSKNETLSKLSLGRQQIGTGSTEISSIDIAKVPFPVTESAKKDSNERSKIIREYLSSKGLTVTSDGYSEQFSKFNKLIRES